MMLPFGLNIQGIVGIAVSVVLATLLVIEKVGHADTRRDLVEFTRLYGGEKSAHQRTQLNYREAAEKARAADAANAARVKAEQSAITQKREAEYEARIADARARAERLHRGSQAAANPGGPGAAGVSRPGATSGGPDGPPAEGGLSQSDALIATEQAIQLEELQRWVREQSRVEVSK